MPLICFYNVVVNLFLLLIKLAGLGLKNKSSSSSSTSSGKCKLKVPPPFNILIQHEIPLMTYAVSLNVSWYLLYRMIVELISCLNRIHFGVLCFFM